MVNMTINGKSVEEALQIILKRVIGTMLRENSASQGES